jgi:DNA-binding response OmpR family regulator
MRRALLVDDDPVQRHLAKVMLEQCGLVVTEAVDGADGKAVVEQATEPFEIVVTDLSMPRMTGEELLVYVRHQLGLRPAIIVLTGSEDGAAEARLMEHGADAYIRKPLDPPGFVARVKAVLGDARRV